MRRRAIWFACLLCLLPVVVFLGLCPGCGPGREQAAEPTPSFSPTPLSEAMSPQPTPTPTTDQTVIAKLGEDTIIYGRLKRNADPAKALLRWRMAGQDDLKHYLVDGLEDKADETINKWLLLQEAGRVGLEVTPEELDRQLAQFKSHFANQEMFAGYLRDLGLTGGGLDVLLTNHILIAKMDLRLKQEFLKEITPEAKQAWYEKHVESRFSPPARTNVRRVCLLYGDKRIPEEASQELRKLLTQVQKQFETVSDVTSRIETMKQMAFQHSETMDGQYSYGLHNVIHVPEAWPSIGKEFGEATRQTPVGELSDIVPIPSGYSFFYVTDQFAGQVYPFEHIVVQKQLPHLMLMEKLEQWRDRKRRDYGVEYYRARLEACVGRDLDTARRVAAEVRATATASPVQTPLGAGEYSAVQPASIATPLRP